VRPLADILDRLAALAEHVPGAATDLLDGLADALKQLRVPVEAEQHPLENRGDVVEPRLDQRLCLDPLNVQLHLSQAHIRADVELDQLAHLGVDRHLRSKIVDLEVDLVDLDHGHVQQHVGPVLDLRRIDDRVVRELLPLAARRAAAVRAARARAAGARAP
jgi:hypothetical protein